MLSSREVEPQYRFHHGKHHSSYGQSSGVNQAHHQETGRRPLRDSAATRAATQSKSSDSLQVARLESKILELQKRLDTQHYQLETLTAETEHFMAVCQQQKAQLGSRGVEMLRQQYEEQLSQLLQDKEKTTELIYALQEQQSVLDQKADEEVLRMELANQALAAHLEEALAEKASLLGAILQAQQQAQLQEGRRGQQEDRAEQLRNIERKLVIALKEMQRIDGKH